MDRFENDSLRSSSGESLPELSPTIAPAGSKRKRLTPKFSMFEDAMLDSVRNLNREATLRDKVAAKIS